MPNTQYLIPELKFGGWPALTELNLAGGIFGHMFFQFPAPQRLKGMAAAIQRFKFGRICPFTAQITPLDLVGRHPGIFGHLTYIPI